MCCGILKFTVLQSTCLISCPLIPQYRARFPIRQCCIFGYCLSLCTIEFHINVSVLRNINVLLPSFVFAVLFWDLFNKWIQLQLYNQCLCQEFWLQFHFLFKSLDSTKASFDENSCTTEFLIKKDFSNSALFH